MTTITTLFVHGITSCAMATTVLTSRQDSFIALVDIAITKTSVTIVTASINVTTSAIKFTHVMVIIMIAALPHASRPSDVLLLATKPCEVLRFCKEGGIGSLVLTPCILVSVATEVIDWGCTEISVEIRVTHK